MPFDPRYRTIFEGLLAAGPAGQASICSDLADRELLLPLLTSLLRGMPSADAREQAAVVRVLALVQLPAAQEASRESRATAWAKRILDIAHACRDLDRGRLKPHERYFVQDMCTYGDGFRPSPRQADWLADIFEKLGGRAAA